MKKSIWISLLINVLSFFIISRIIHGIKFNSFLSLVLTAIVFGIINAIIRPVLVFFSIPMLFLTLGIFMFVINAILLEIVDLLVPGFSISSFSTALLGALLLSIVSYIISLIFYPQRR